MRETLRISARADYAIRATAAIAAMPSEELVTADTLACAQDIPLRFLLVILSDLRRAGIVESRRGPGGGYRLQRPVHELNLAQIIAAVDGSSGHHGWEETTDAADPSTTAKVHAMWSTLRTSLHDALERTTIADVLAGRQPTLD